MHSNLKNLVKHYGYEPIDKQYPVSLVDAKIIEELKIAVGLLNRSTPLVAILDGYKTKISDEEILKKIEEFTLALETNDADAEGEPTKDFLRFETHTIPVALIFSIEAEDKYGDDDREQYNILINKSPDLAKKLPLVSDLRFVYYSADVRDERLQYLHQALQDKTNIRFL